MRTREVFEEEYWPELRGYIDRARNGNQMAWEYLRTRYHRVVMAQARQYYLVGAERSDVECVAWYGFSVAIMDYRHHPRGKLGRFINTCVRNKLVSELVRTRTQGNRFLSESDRPDNVDEFGWQRHVVSEVICRVCMKEFLGKLTEIEYKSVMKFADGYSYKEIAQYYGYKTKSIDNALKRVRNKYWIYQLDLGLQ